METNVSSPETATLMIFFQLFCWNCSTRIPDLSIVLDLSLVLCVLMNCDTIGTRFQMSSFFSRCVQMDDRFLSVNVVNREEHMKIDVSENSIVITYVPFPLYEKDVRVGIRSHSALWDQLQLDIRRSEVCIDGEVMATANEIPPTIGSRYLQFMTQSVMALPFIGVQRSTEMPVCQQNTPMKIDLWGSKFYIHKGLRVMLDEKTSIPVCVNVFIDVEHEHAIIECDFGEVEYNKIDW